jgi:cobalt transporter subunit CbtA
MFARILFAAVVAGLAAGLVMTAIQQWRVVPLIVAAELYEGDAHAHDPAAAAPPEAWTPANGMERTAYTVLANLLASVGFALVLAAVSVLADIAITPANGLLWGLGGFIAVQLAPAVGLPPELPGMLTADLGARQLWWVGTVAATGAGLVVLAKWRHPVALGLAAALIAGPHLVGAPAAPHGQSDVPAELASAYAANALGATAALWLVLGPVLGVLLERFRQREAA